MSAGSSIRPRLQQPHHGHVAEVLDVHRAAPGEMEQPLDALRRTPALVRAAVVGLALGADERRAARRTGLRHRPAAGALLPLGEHGADDLGDHVAGPADDDGVALAHVLAPDLLLVVQGGVGDRDAAHDHGVEHRERRDLARAARVHVDVLEQGGALLGRELVGDGPPRGVAGGTELALQVDLVDLDDGAVDLPVDGVPLLPPSR